MLCLAWAEVVLLEGQFLAVSNSALSQLFNVPFISLFCVTLLCQKWCTIPWLLLNLTDGYLTLHHHQLGPDGIIPFHVINFGQMPSGQCCVFVAHTRCICSHLYPNVRCFPGHCWASPKVLRPKAQGTIHRGARHVGTQWKEMCRNNAATRAAESNTPSETKLLTISQPSWGLENKMHSTVEHWSSALGLHILLSILKPRKTS